MPELPEIRALAERVGQGFQGRKFLAGHLLGFWALKTVAPSLEDLEGRTLERVRSRGKFVLLEFDPPATIAVHLGQAGRVDLEAPAKSTRPRGALVRLDFDGEVAVLVREHGKERRAGVWVLADGDPGPLGALGPEPFESGFADLVLRGDDARRLSTVLRDQRTVAGIGRGYADDILLRARLSPFASLARLSADERARLLDAARTTLSEATERERGRSGGLSDASLGDRFAAHRRAGQPCPQCGTRLERVAYESYELVYCPTCQTRGRLLADRRLSRLLR